MNGCPGGTYIHTPKEIRVARLYMIPKPEKMYQNEPKMYQMVIKYPKYP
jgi:hypothetical protein